MTEYHTIDMELEICIQIPALTLTCGCDSKTLKFSYFSELRKYITIQLLNLRINTENTSHIRTEKLRKQTKELVYLLLVPLLHNSRYPLKSSIL